MQRRMLISRIAAIKNYEAKLKELAFAIEEGPGVSSELSRELLVEFIEEFPFEVSLWKKLAESFEQGSAADKEEKVIGILRWGANFNPRSLELIIFCLETIERLGMASEIKISFLKESLPGLIFDKNKRSLWSVFLALLVQNKNAGFSVKETHGFFLTYAKFNVLNDSIVGEEIAFYSRFVGELSGEELRELEGEDSLIAKNEKQRQASVQEKIAQFRNSLLNAAENPIKKLLIKIHILLAEGNLKDAFWWIDLIQEAKTFTIEDNFFKTELLIYLHELSLTKMPQSALLWKTYLDFLESNSHEEYFFGFCEKYLKTIRFIFPRFFILLIEKIEPIEQTKGVLLQNFILSIFKEISESDYLAGENVYICFEQVFLCLVYANALENYNLICQIQKTLVENFFFNFNEDEIFQILEQILGSFLSHKENFYENHLTKIFEGLKYKKITSILFLKIANSFFEWVEKCNLDDKQAVENLKDLFQSIRFNYQFDVDIREGLNLHLMSQNVQDCFQKLYCDFYYDIDVLKAAQLNSFLSFE